jgi:hypothetical protein
MRPPTIRGNLFDSGLHVHLVVRLTKSRLGRLHVLGMTVSVQKRVSFFNSERAFNYYHSRQLWTALRLGRRKSIKRVSPWIGNHRTKFYGLMSNTSASQSIKSSYGVGLAVKDRKTDTSASICQFLKTPLLPKRLRPQTGNIARA